MSGFVDLLLGRGLSRRGRSQMGYEGIGILWSFLLASLNSSPILHFLIKVHFPVSPNMYFSFPHIVSHLRALGKCKAHQISEFFSTKMAWADISPFGFLGSLLSWLCCLLVQATQCITVSQPCTNCCHKNCLRQRFLKTQKAINIRGKILINWTTLKLRTSVLQNHQESKRILHKLEEESFNTYVWQRTLLWNT